MKKKKSKIELAREIIANLRRGMNRPPLGPTGREIRLENASLELRPGIGAAPRNKLQTSHF